MRERAVALVAHIGRREMLLLDLEGQRPNARAPDQPCQVTDKIRSQASWSMPILG